MPLSPREPSPTLGELIDQALRGDRDALGRLAGALFAPTERAIAKSLLRHNISDSATLVQVHTQFLDEKLSNASFLSELAKAADVTAYVAAAATNLAVSFARSTAAPPPTTSLDSPARGSDVEALADGLPDRTPSPFEELDSREGVDAIHAALEELNPEDMWLLRVRLVEIWDWPEDWIEALAVRRGVAMDVVRKDLESRASGQGERRRENERSLEHCQKEIASIDTKLRAIQAELQRRGEPIDPSRDEVSPERQRSLARSPQARRTADSSELHGTLGALWSRREAVTIRLGNANRAAAGDLPGGPDWRDCLRILGKLPADQTAQDRAINSVNQRWRRLSERLRAALIQRGRDVEP